MNQKMIKEKTSKQNCDFNHTKQNTASADSISLDCKYTTPKMLRDKAECEGAQRKACTLK